MSTVYGYARCSTDEGRQDINRQKRELKTLGVEKDCHIYWEYESGTKADRTELQKLFDLVKPGDTIAITEVSRLTRSTKHLCEILQIIRERKIRLIIGSFVVDCRNDVIDPMTKGMLMMWGVFAEMERDIISQRVKSGIENAKAKGKIVGRPKMNTTNIPTKFMQYYPLYKKGELNVTSLAKLLKCSRTTVYKYIDIIKKEDMVVRHKINTRKDKKNKTENS